MVEYAPANLDWGNQPWDWSFWKCESWFMIGTVEFMRFGCLLFSPRGSSLYSGDRDEDTRANPRETAVICEVVGISKAIPTHF
jgi:hypothetical protein